MYTCFNLLSDSAAFMRFCTSNKRNDYFSAYHAKLTVNDSFWTFILTDVIFCPFHYYSNTTGASASQTYENMICVIFAVITIIDFRLF